MIKITSLHRRVRLDTGEPVIDNRNCNVFIAIDANFNRGHFTLTPEEGQNLDLLCEAIEQRIGQDVADQDLILPEREREPEEKN